VIIAMVFFKCGGLCVAIGRDMMRMMEMAELRRLERQRMNYSGALPDMA
jgi:hypothetical protein